MALEEMVSPAICAECGGRRLRADSLAVRIGGRGLAEYTSMTIEDAIEAFDQINLEQREEQIPRLVLREIKSKLRFLETLGLGYLKLDPPSATFSGRAGQRLLIST